MRGAKGLLVRWLPRAMAHDRAVLSVAAGLVLLAAGALASLPRSLMPAFNEGSLTIQLSALPGITLADSSEIGRIAERLLLEVPEVAAVGRRTGRAEQDEHAQGVETSEIDVALTPGLRRRAEIVSDIRQRLALLPTSVNIGQPVSHRVDHLASGVRAGLVVKLFGEDFEQLDALAARLARELAGIRGLVDVQVEPQARVPSVEVRPDGRRAAFYGVAPAAVDGVTGLAQGRRLSHRWSEDLRTEVVLRLAERDRSNLGHVLVETPDGRVPLRDLADVVEADARNRIEREDGRRRIAVLANLDGGNAGATIDAVRAAMAGLGLPPGYRMALEGSHAGQAAAARTVLGAALAVLLLTLLILIARYRALPLALIVLSSIPLALVGGVAALVLAGLPLSLASVVGFVTLAGIALRNSILKVSHALNLHRVDGMSFGDELVLRASRERLAPVLMTALAAAGGLLPLALGADAAGKEILYPVAVVVIGGLLSCTLLDSFVVPLLLRRFGVRSFARSRMRHAQASF
jgi:HME family heavy-metal exporter